MDELQQTSEPRGKWLEPSEKFWQRHRCSIPASYNRTTSDRWECFCTKTFRFDYETARWMSEEDDEK